MPQDFDAGRPIYLQLLELITLQLAAGELAPGQRLPGVRELAGQYGVNPNTVQRTMAELERQGLVYSERNAGRFVTNDHDRIAETRRALAVEKTKEYWLQMAGLGLGLETVIAMLRQTAGGEEEIV